MARSGEAGQRGPKVRSDCWIRVELREEGGLEIALESRVAGMYGDQIRGQMETGGRDMGVAHARIEVEDKGALPFTLAARLECAVRRSGHRPAGPYLLGSWSPEQESLMHLLPGIHHSLPR